jgi:hypothetical protein
MYSVWSIYHSTAGRMASHIGIYYAGISIYKTSSHIKDCLVHIEISGQARDDTFEIFLYYYSPITTY